MLIPYYRNFPSRITPHNLLQIQYAMPSVPIVAKRKRCCNSCVLQEKLIHFPALISVQDRDVWRSSPLSHRGREILKISCAHGGFMVGLCVALRTAASFSSHAPRPSPGVSGVGLFLVSGEWDCAHTSIAFVHAFTYIVC